MPQQPVVTRHGELIAEFLLHLETRYTDLCLFLAGSSLRHRPGLPLLEFACVNKVRQLTLPTIGLRAAYSQALYNCPLPLRQQDRRDAAVQLLPWLPVVKSPILKGSTCHNGRGEHGYQFGIAPFRP